MEQRKAGDHHRIPRQSREKQSYEACSPAMSIERMQERSAISASESERSERGASPYPTSLAASDYCQSGSGEHYAGSSHDYEGYGSGEPIEAYDEVAAAEDMDEYMEEDLSSEPPPQRSDSVSDDALNNSLPP